MSSAAFIRFLIFGNIFICSAGFAQLSKGRASGIKVIDKQGLKEVNANTHYYFGPEGKVLLKVHPTKVLVKFKDSSPISTNKAVYNLPLQNCLSVAGTHKSLHEKDKLHNGAFVVDYSGTNSLSASDKLRKSKDVEYVYPIYQYDQSEVALTNDFVVQLQNAVSKNELNQLVQSLNISILKQDKYDPSIYYLRVTSSSAGDVLEMANYLFKAGKVKFSEPDLIQFIQKHTTDPLYSQQWSIRNTGQYSGTAGADMDVELAWTITTGSPLVKIAVLDEGVDLNHPDLKANLLPGYDATGLGSAGDASNNDAHGTACSGQIVGIANNNLGGTGIAYGCKVIPVRIAYENASGGWVITNSGTADAINWAWSNGASVLSNSWGGGSPSSLIINAFNAAFTNGRGGLGSVVLASSGNGNTTSVKFPSNIANIIAVGASSMCDQRKSPTSCDGETWWGCDYGTGLDVVAPGVKISTTDISGSRGYNTGDYTSTFNGTSSACPNTAAVMALILSANPSISANAARIALESTCEKIGGYTYTANTAGQPNGTWAFEAGYGRVNAYNAVLAALNNPTNCLGTTLLSAATGSVSDGSGNNNYSNNANCSWLISPPGATKITLSFTNFKTEDANDVVRVYNGATTVSGLLGTFSGTNLPSTLTSTGGNLLIVFTSNASVTNEGWAATYNSDANGSYCTPLTTLTATSGSFTDGSGANNYGDNSSCTWLIQPTGAVYVTLNFTQFSTESNYDYVRVYDGSSSSAPLLGSYSGTTLPTTLQSSGSSLFLTFDSDGSVNQSGWAANYTSASSVAYCSGLTTLTATSGSFSDGSAGLNYLNNSSCTWVIQPQNVNQITLTFNQFSTQANADYVTVYNGTTTSAPILGVFSGSSLPASINGNGALIVVFTSNNSVTGAGFSATYNSSQVFCSGNTLLTAPTGSLSDGSGALNYASNSNCTWLVNPPGATSIVLSFSQFSTESNYDYVRLYNGTSTSAPIIGSYSGTTLPQQITSNGPIFISFTTDGSVTYDGWSANYTAGFTTLYCSGNTSLTASSGTITDGSGSNNYGDNSNCTWLIAPSNGPTSIVLNFTAFNTEPSNDILRVYGGSSSSATLLGTYSGSTLPGTITVPGGSVFLSFSSNNTITGQGWSLNYSGITTTYCSGLTTLTAPSGIVSDGSSAATYLNNSNCQWLINPAGATSISLTFSQFYTESCCDYVSIYNGTTTSAPLLGSFRGTTLPNLVTSSGPMLIVFYTDGSVVADGWTANYNASFTPIYCSGNTVLTASTATITDGSGGNNYGDNSNCSWLINPSIGANFISLSFSSFNTEQNFDIVRVYNGSSATSPLLGTFSGSNLPPTLTVAGPSMFLTFTTNNTITGQGWSATYTASSLNFCSGLTLVTAPSGIVTDGSGASNYLNNSNCQWIINPAGATSITINFTQFVTESGWDYVYVYNGTTTGSPLLGSYTGSTLPPSITNNGPVLIRFYTDGSSTYAGWSLSYTSGFTPIYCSGTTTLNAVSGTFSDGSGASNYGDNSNCSWLISPSATPNFISLSFSSFDTELGNDIFRVYNGSSAAYPLVASFTGTNIPSTITVAGTSLFVNFTSNSSITGQGWTANYNSFTSTYCNSLSTLTSTSGTLSDGSGAASYVNNTNCTWLISPPGATSVTLTFSQFYLESCCDYVRIYNGTTTGSPLLGSFNGSTIPASVTSNGPMLIVFTTDGSVTYDGWTASYTSSNTPIYCSGTTTLNSSSGTFSDGSGTSDYNNGTNCSWLISPSVTPTFISLSFSSFSTEQNLDIVRVYNGPTSGYPLVASFSGTNIPATITVAGTSLFVNFASNNSITGQGWTANYNSFTSSYCSALATITSASGSLSDGSGAASYVNNTNCTWLISPPGATSVTLSFSQFYLESCCDYVRIYNGTTTGSPLLGTFNGNTIPASVTSNGPMLIVFTSDGSVTYDGWTASYTSSNSPVYCNGNTTLNAVSGTFTDGSGSSDYNNNTNCNWLISPSVTPTFITLSFSEFNTESNVDIVRVYNGPSNAYPLVASFSGTNIPSTITVAGTSLFVNFSSNSSITGQGWTANYNSFTSTFCAGFTLVTSPSGIISDGSGASNYVNSTNCQWLINPAGATSISISFSQFATESSWDYVYLYNGTSTGSQLLGSYSGNLLPPTLTSTGPILLVFTSDGSNVYAGWTASYTALLATNTTVNGIQVNTNTLNFGNTGGIQTLTVTNSGSWTVTSTSNWIIIGPSSGTGNGIVTISVPSNLSTSSLTGNLVFSNGQSQYIVKVNESAAIVTDLNKFGAFEDIQLHPNPTEGAVNLWITSKLEGQLTVVVKDVLGKTIYSSNHWLSNKENTIPLDLSGYNAGTYIIEINLNGSGTNRRVIKL